MSRWNGSSRRIVAGWHDENGNSIDVKTVLGKALTQELALDDGNATGPRGNARASE
jgi:hypothetical protein